MEITRAAWFGFALMAVIAVALAAGSSRRPAIMYRKQLPRIYELRDLVPVPPPPDAYFRDLDRTLAEIPQKLKQYRDIENDLRGLDSAAWAFLKSELAPLLGAKDAKRGWQPLFDKLNEAKAYNYLKRAGYERVTFIPRSIVKSQKTPDLCGHAGPVKALCEVKTINISEIEADRRSSGGVGSSENHLPEGFFNKLALDLAVARTQMDAYDAGPVTRRIAYVIVNFDDALHEYGELYQAQIEEYMKFSHPVPEVEAVFDIKPPFYAATS